MAATAGVFGGDEVSAVAIDLGCSSLRVGWAGEDAPRAILPSLVAAHNTNDSEGDSSMLDASAPSTKKRRRFVGDQATSIFRPNTALESILDPATSLFASSSSSSSSSTATTTDAFADLTEHALASILSADPTQHPLIFTEPSHNTKDAREALTELVFEQLQAPAYYLANQTVLSAFASGKGTALILDIGASHATAAPAIAAVLDQTPWNEAAALARPTRLYEFPTGFSDVFGIERFRSAEVLFTPHLWDGALLPDGTSVLPPQQQQHGGKAGGVAVPYRSTTQLVLDAINEADVDIRSSLASNIVLVGGGSCTPGLVDRLSYELGVGAAGQKTKLHAPGNPIERRYSSWLGASILASLGTFHQLWISRQEYEEHGVSIVHARCK
ncbi:unnamed protein product [Tilletia caries]|nr:unnamed protein product [Tilletia caries]